MSTEIQETTTKKWNGFEFTITHRCNHSVTKRLMEPTLFQAKRAAKHLATIKCYECLVAEGTMLREVVA